MVALDAHAKRLFLCMYFSHSTIHLSAVTPVPCPVVFLVLCFCLVCCLNYDLNLLAQSNDPFAVPSKCSKFLQPYPFLLHKPQHNSRTLTVSFSLQDTVSGHILQSSECRKNFFFNHILFRYINRGTIRNSNRYTSFSLQDTIGGRTLQWNEPHCEPSAFHTIKKMFGGGIDS